MASCFSSSLLAAVLVIYSSLHLGSAARPVAGATSVEFIKSSCSATAYPNLCYSSLSSHASTIQQSPKLLAGAALAVSLSSARSTTLELRRLAGGAGMTPREVGAMRDCMEELNESVDRLSSSVTEMNRINGFNFELMMSDIQTWISAALTDEDTCLDGFAGKAMAGHVKTAVRERILTVAHITSNALALVNSYAALHG